MKKLDKRKHMRLDFLYQIVLEHYFRNRVTNKKDVQQELGIHANTYIENQQLDDILKGMLLFSPPRATFLRLSKAVHLYLHQR